MHQHEGIVVVAYLVGQPRSEVIAAFDLAGVPVEEFTTNVVDQYGCEGIAAKVNLQAEADALLEACRDAEVNGHLCLDKTWRLE